MIFEFVKVCSYSFETIKIIYRWKTFSIANFSQIKNRDMIYMFEQIKCKYNFLYLLFVNIHSNHSFTLFYKVVVCFVCCFVYNCI